FDEGSVSEFEFGSMIALVSGLAPETSLRLTTALYSGDVTALHLRGTDGALLADVPTVKAYAFGIHGDSVGTTYALSPDGQSVAWVGDSGLTLWRDGEVMPLDFSAEAL